MRLKHGWQGAIVAAVLCIGMAQQAVAQCSDATVAANRQAYMKELTSSAAQATAAAPGPPMRSQCQMQSMANLLKMPMLSDPLSMGASSVMPLLQMVQTVSQFGSGGAGINLPLQNAGGGSLPNVSAIMPNVSALMQSAVPSGHCTN